MTGDLKEILKKHLAWLRDEKDGKRADLTGANLTDANLTCANLDFASLPLWCGSLNVKVDIRIGAQIAYHFCRLKSEDPDIKTAQQAIKDLANKFHRVNECGRIE
jgi:uncharacterized protein YjbI with pentapeptide repeats